MNNNKKSAWKVGVGAAGAVGAAKVIGGAGLLKSGFLFKTVATLFVSLFLYSRMYGLGFAALVIVLLFVHESGHWLWMKMYKLDPEAPVFVPFMGAYVAMNKMPADEATHAWVAYAGPLVGTIGALALYIAGAVTSNAALMAGGNFGFFLNLLQLIPAKPLDGGFIASAVSKWLLIPGTIIALLLGFLCQSILLIILGGISAFSLFRKKPQTEMKPATGKQRFAIGAAYISLALFLGGIQVFAQWQMTNNKDYAAAQIGYLTDQMQHDHDPELLRERSQCYAVVGKLSEAESDLSSAIASGSDDSDDYVTLARLRLAQGKIDATTHATLDKALSLTTEEPWNAWKVGRGYLLSDDLPNALKAAEHCDDVDKNDIKAIAFYRTNKPKDASACFELALKGVTSYMEGTYCQRALMEISNGNLPLAKVDIDEAQSHDSDDPLPMLVRGWYALRTGDTTTALKQADDAMKQFDDDNFERSDKQHVLSACHNLKAAAYKKLSSTATSDADKEKFDRLASEELNAAGTVPGPAYYSPLTYGVPTQ